MKTAFDEATNITQKLSETRVQTSKKLGGQENLMAKYTQLSMDLDRELKKLNTLLFEAEYLIESLNNKNHKKLLRLRYLKGDTWPEISEEMNYSLRQIYRLHHSALREIEGLKKFRKK